MNVMVLLAKLHCWLTRHRGMMAGIFVFLGLFAVAGFAFAQTPPPPISPVTQIVAGVDPFWWLALGLTFILQVIAWVIGKLIVLVIGMIIVPVLGYNGFADSNIIAIGWPLVRDIVNMFVIIILLVIAVETILGAGKANWEKQLPRLFIAMIAVNFSRLFCLLMIDFGQIIMFTFVNAIRDIAAGNFINLFQLNSFLSLDIANLKTQLDTAAGNGGLNALGYLGTSYAMVVFLSMVLSVLMLMAVIFIYRIVILWVLVIMSPLAFFMGGVKDLISQGGSVYADWWKQMTGAITLGPILAFFLWLSLAAAASGPIATSERFPTLQSPDSNEVFGTGLATEIFQLDKFLSLFIALVLLTAGFKAASGAAGALGGVAATFINEQQGKKLAMGLAAAPARYAARGVAYAGIETGRAIERRQGFAGALGKGITEGGAAIAPYVPVFGSALSRQAGRVGGAMEQFSKEQQVSGIKDAAKAVANYSDTQKASRVMDSIERPGTPFSPTAEYENVAIDISTITDSKKMAEAEKNIKAKYADQPDLANTMVDKFKKRTFSNFEKHKDALIAANPAIEEKMLKAKTRELHLLGDDDKKKIVEDEKFNPANLSAAAVQDDKVRDLLKEKKVGNVYDQESKTWKSVSVWENMELGKGIGKDLKDAVAKVLPEEVPNMTVENLQKNIAGGQLKLENIRAEQMEDPKTVEKVVKAALGSGVKLEIDQIGDQQMRQELAKNPNMTPEQVTALQDRAGRAQKNFRDAADKQLQKDRVGATSGKARAEIDKMSIEVTGDAAKALGYVGADQPGGGKFLTPAEGGRAGIQESVGINVQQDITFVNKLPEKALDGNTEMTQAVLSKITPEDLNRDVSKFFLADAAGKKAIQDAVNKLEGPARLLSASSGELGEKMSALHEHLTTVKAAMEKAGQS